MVTLTILATSNRSMLVVMAAAARLPAIHSRSEFVESDGLMSYGADQHDAYRRIAAFVDKILKGAKRADLPVEQPTRFEMAINGETANALGLKIPHALLISADRVSE